MHTPAPPDWNAIFLYPMLRIFWPYVLLWAVIVVGRWAFKLWKLQRLAASGIEQIDRMTGREFEEYLEALFTNLGYQVERTPYVGDYGADLIVRKDGVKTVVQAKRHTRRVGAKAIGEVLRAKGNYKCANGMLVTNNGFTQQAIQEARNNGIVLWDRNELVRQLLSVRKVGDPATCPAGETVAETPRREKQAPAAAVRLDEPAVAEPTVQKVAPAYNASANNAACQVCGKVVSPRVRQYCLDHPDRFGGQVFCIEHQRSREAEALRRARDRDWFGTE